jgi:8-oxo-dGTP diphosphatase
VNKPRVGVAVILCDMPKPGDAHILLGLRKGSHGAGTWGFPGGHLEFGESFETCASRELYEETGILLAPDQFHLTACTNDFFEKENMHYVTVFLSAVRTSQEPTVREPDKCEEWRWMQVEGLFSKGLFLPVLNLLQHYGRTPCFW